MEIPSSQSAKTNVTCDPLICLLLRSVMHAHESLWYHLKSYFQDFGVFCCLSYLFGVLRHPFVLKGFLLKTSPTAVLLCSLETRFLCSTE